MKKTTFGAKPAFAIAMSIDTGSIVFLRDGKVMGSMTRGMSVEFCQKLIEWVPEETPIADAVKGEVKRAKLTVVQ